MYLVKHKIKIYNALGSCVINYEFQITNYGKGVMTVETRHALSQQRIVISHLPAGLYFIQIGNYSQQFLVVR